MYYTVIKHSSHLRTLAKCRKHSPAARAFYISLVFSNACHVLSQCKTRLRLLYLINNNINTALFNLKENYKKLSEGKKDIGERVNRYSVMQIMTAKTTTLRTISVHVVLNSVMFPQILYDIVLYA